MANSRSLVLRTTAHSGGERNDRCRHRNVQGLDVARHRDVHQTIKLVDHILWNAVRLASEYDGMWPTPVNLRQCNTLPPHCTKNRAPIDCEFRG